LIDGWNDGWIDGLIDGSMDEQMDGRMDGQIHRFSMVQLQQFTTNSTKNTRQMVSINKQRRRARHVKSFAKYKYWQ
jgi:hypothetical protein